MYKVKVYVTFKESVLDPQGEAVKNSLTNLGYNEVEDVRIGKYVELYVDKGAGDIETRVKEICAKVLVNPVIENYRFEIEEVVSQ